MHVFKAFETFYYVTSSRMATKLYSNPISSLPFTYSITDLVIWLAELHAIVFICISEIPTEVEYFYILPLGTAFSCLS